MKPIMNPPPMTTLGIEKAIIDMPKAFLFPSFRYSIKELNNIMALHRNPTAIRISNGTDSFDVPGIVGIIQGNQVTATPKSDALQNIKIPAIREKVKDFDFSLPLIFLILLIFCRRYNNFKNKLSTNFSVQNGCLKAFRRKNKLNRRFIFVKNPFLSSDLII